MASTAASLVAALTIFNVQAEATKAPASGLSMGRQDQITPSSPQTGTTGAVVPSDNAAKDAVPAPAEPANPPSRPAQKPKIYGDPKSGLKPEPAPAEPVPTPPVQAEVPPK